jgi:dTDP-4-amino-4,6-dideoxygalactose transaminase
MNIPLTLSDLSHIPMCDSNNNILSQGIQSLVHYPVPVHAQKAYNRLDRLPITDKIVDNILSLPVSPWLNESEVVEISEKTKSILAKLR